MKNLNGADTEIFSHPSFGNLFALITFTLLRLSRGVSVLKILCPLIFPIHLEVGHFCVILHSAIDTDLSLKSFLHSDQYYLYYRPQTKFAKVMFSRMSVCPQRGEVSAPLHAGIHIPWADTPPRDQTPSSAQCMLGDTGNKRVVHILLKCILVSDSKSYLRRLNWPRSEKN